MRLRCPGCYLPMQRSWTRDVWECWLCGTEITGLFVAAFLTRGWRRWWWRATGLLERA